MTRDAPRPPRRGLPALLGAVALAAVITADTGHIARAARVPEAPGTNPQLVTPEIARKVEALLSRMTLKEKLGQLVQYGDTGTPAPTEANGGIALADNPDAGTHVDPMQLAAEGGMGSMLNVAGAVLTSEFQHAAVDRSRLHIPLLFGADVIHGYRTIYPVPLGLAAMWDPPLVRDLSHMAAAEASAAGIRWVYSPMVDISRDARWGRTVEGAGEDPFLGAAMARAYVQGYQGDRLSDPDSVAASVKHFAAYGAAEAGRDYAASDMSDIRLRQVYLPPYEAAVQAGAATVMSAFTDVNGVPATGNRYLLDRILRKEWGFDGFVVSDYTAVRELVPHGVARNVAEASRMALGAGVDVDMMSHDYDSQLPGLIADGKVPMAEVDAAVRRVLRVKFALGLFDHPYARPPDPEGDEPARLALARRAARESLVLLQNRKAGGAPLLPLSGKDRTVALIGPLADDPGDMIGAWSGAPRADETVTLRRAMAARMKASGGRLVYARGTGIADGTRDGFAAAVAAARSADVAVLALGESGDMSGEAASRAHLGLPGDQLDLLKAVVATGTPVVLVTFSGRPLVLDWPVTHVPAMLEAWFPGTEAGDAIADVLFGDTSPSGKLPMSFPRAVGQEPLYYDELPTGRPAHGLDYGPPTGPGKYVSRYIDVPNSPLFPFGYGLSYTNFAYSDVRVSRGHLPLDAARPGAQDLVTVTARLTNTGDRTATEVAQLYLNDRGTSVAQPRRALKGFARVTLKPGESRVLRFPLGFRALSFIDADSRRVVEPSDYTVWVGGSSDATEAARFDVTE